MDHGSYPECAFLEVVHVRVTNQMMNIQLLQNLRQSNERTLKMQDQLATGSRIHRPGDDPVGVGYVMRYDSELSRNEEFLENANTALGWLRTMDSVLKQAMDVLHRARVLVQQAATGTTGEQGREAIAIEMEQLREQMVLIGNSEYGGRFLFNGQKTDVAPYSLDNAPNDTTNKGVFRLNVAPGISVPVSITGEVIFGEAGSEQNVFKVFDDIITHLRNGDQEQLAQSLGRIDERMDNISTQWSEVGARTNRFELIVQRLTDQEVNLKTLRSEVNDVDMAKIIIDLKTQESVHQAALATGARIMQVSLLDFLR